MLVNTINFIENMAGLKIYGVKKYINGTEKDHTCDNRQGTYQTFQGCLETKSSPRAMGFKMKKGPLKNYH